MISINSLSQDLLPNIYVKNLTLNPKYDTKNLLLSKKTNGTVSIDPNQNVSTLSEQSSCDMTLSMKFLRNSNTMSDLALLLESELKQTFYYVIHQITDKQTYKDILSLAKQAPNVLTQPNNSTNVTTEAGLIFSDFGEYDPLNFLQNLPEQYLDDGTVLNEVIINRSFNFKKDTDFLAYVVVAAVIHEGSTNIYMSKPLKEIIILDGKFQNRGMVFTIAPYSFKESQSVEFLEKLQKIQRDYGKPGDIWAGPVHKHNNRFMAGGVHLSGDTQPYLDYSIVPVRKYVDNRVQEKIERNIINITQTTEQLFGAITSPYQSASKTLTSQNNTPLEYISDFNLSQNRLGHVFGSFAIDKKRILLTKSAFPNLIKNAQKITQKASQSEQYKDFIKSLVNKMTLTNLKIYQRKELLGVVDSNQNTSTSYYEFLQDGTPVPGADNLKMAISRNAFSTPTAGGSIEGLDFFSFKHYNRSSPGAVNKYYTEAGYIDPTLNEVKEIKAAVVNAMVSVDSLISIVENNPPKSVDNVRKSGFDTRTEKINSSIVAAIKNGEYDNISITDGILDSIRTLPSKIYVYFYNPDISLIELESYFFNLVNIDTTTISKLLILEKFLNNLNNKLALDLDSHGGKPLKTTSPQPISTLLKQGDIESSRGDRTMLVKSAKNKITVYDFGYDFTGAIDNVNISQGGFENPGREGSVATTITTKDFSKACTLSFLEIKNPNQNLYSSLISEFKPYGLTSKKVNDIIHSYLNIPVNSLSTCVVLPKTVFSYEVNSTATSLNAITTLLAITKMKEGVIENNTKSILGENSTGVVIKEDLISILAQSGVSIPSVGQTELDRKLQSTLSTSPAGNLNQSYVVEATTNDLLGVEPLIDPGLGVKSNKFKTATPFTRQTVASGDDDTTKNNLMSALLSRKKFSKTSNKSFVLEMSKTNFRPYKPQSQAFLSAVKNPPAQVLCLSIESGTNPFRSFDQNLIKPEITNMPTYVKNGVVSPSLMSYFWFIHQNIVKVEYLSGYKQNMKTPKWKTLTSAVMTKLVENQQILCRLVRYEDPYYINKNLVKAFDLPLINSHFLLRKSKSNIPQTGVEDTPEEVYETLSGDISAKDVADILSNTLKLTQGAEGSPDFSNILDILSSDPPKEALEKIAGKGNPAQRVNEENMPASTKSTQKQKTVSEKFSKVGGKKKPPIGNFFK